MNRLEGVMRFLIGLALVGWLVCFGIFVAFISTHGVKDLPWWPVALILASAVGLGFSGKLFKVIFQRNSRG